MNILKAPGGHSPLISRRSASATRIVRQTPVSTIMTTLPLQHSERPISGRRTSSRMSTEPDTSGFQDVLRRAGAGDELAWQQVVDAYGSRVYALLFSRCRNAELAEELTQSTFCTVVTKLSAYDEQGKFEPWLFRIAMNRLRDEMRRRGRHAVNIANDTLSTMETTPRIESAPGAGGEQQMELSRALREAVASLQESDQEILHLRHVSGLSFKQIAQVLQQPLGTVLARHFRAFKRLKEMMGVDEED